MPDNSSAPGPTRRHFLKTAGRGVGILALSRLLPSPLAAAIKTASPQSERNVLVLVQLAGGNDGLNTVIPFEDDRYYRLRPTLAVTKTAVRRLDRGLGLHPACNGLARLYDRGQLAIVQNVGYANPSRSHYRSSEIWNTASDANVSSGWVARFFAHGCARRPTTALLGAYASARPPRAFLSELSPLPSALAVDRIRALCAAAPDRRQSFAGSLDNVARAIHAESAARVYFLSLDGFDTHYDQAARHAERLRTLSDGLLAFQKKLRSLGIADRVLTMTVSEFGRRPRENEGGGTDHGTAAPLFVMGSRIRGGLIGQAPTLTETAGADIPHAVDFRQVYATVLERWLDCPSASVLGRSYDPLGFV